MFTDIEKSHIIACKAKINNLVTSLGISKSPDVIIAGGVFTSILNDEEYKDIDVFILNDNDKYVMTTNSIKQNNSEYLTKNNPSIKEVYLDDTREINYIFTSFKSRKEVIDHFDYVHCCVSYDFNSLYITEQMYQAIRKKKLIVNNIDNMKSYRRDKFLIRGFTE